MSNYPPTWHICSNIDKKNEVYFLFKMLENFLKSLFISCKVYASSKNMALVKKLFKCLNGENVATIFSNMNFCSSK
ncbi:MAG: hypothetical protein AUK31_09520 [Fibrobacteres bacterium CG2_30_45_31]|nr:MAG: hypothetical protein AUK31_09520 [Fibrobacteres bacterium CG2_30_45_31]